MAAPLAENEKERALELAEMDLDYSDLTEQLEDLNRLAAKIAGTSISFVNLIDSYTQWTVSNTGLELKQMPREDSVCQYTILEDENFEVKKLSADERFKDKFYVKGEPKLDYYFGIPLSTSDGNNIGALCVLDREKKELESETVEKLSLIAKAVVNRLTMLKEHNEMREELEKIKETKRKLVHDIRGPVNGIIGVSDMIRGNGGKDGSDEEDRLIDMIQKSARSVMDLANEILEEADESDKTGSGRIDCSGLCEKLRTLYKPQARAKDIDLEIQARETDSRSFSKSKLLQIAGNLVSNSIKFTPEGGTVEVTVNMDKLEDHHQNLLRIEVRDSGIGISQEKVDKILQGEKVTSAGTEGEEGFGYGLSLVLHLVRQKEGTLEIDSEPGEGSVFKVMIPV